MKAVVLESFNSPLVYKDVKKPTPQADEVLVRALLAGVCRTDLKIQRGQIERVALAGLPRIPGHEFVGIVEAAGEQVKDDLVGQMVTCHFYVSCGECWYCRTHDTTLCTALKGQIGFTKDGGWAEYVCIPAANAIPVMGVSPQGAAIVSDAIATPYRAIIKKARLKPKERFLVIGVGGLGVHAIQIAKALGANVTAVDVIQSKIDLAVKYGADEAFLFDDGVMHSQMGEMDVVLDAAGVTSSLDLGVRALRPGGRLVLNGYTPGVLPPLDTTAVMRKEVKIIGSRASTAFDIIESIDLMRQGKIVPVIDRTLPLEQANEALHLLSGTGVVGRVLLKIAETVS